MSQKTQEKFMTSDDSPSGITRRSLISSAVAATAVLASGTAFAGTGGAKPSLSKLERVIDSSLDCVKRGEACVDHCMNLFKAGDSSLAECADSVNEMLSMCNAMVQMASSKSNHLMEFAKVCMAVCVDCEKECRKHENKYADCKACADACANCAKECKTAIM